MTSQPAGLTLCCLEIPSYVRGYHAYSNLWTPVVGQVLLLTREPDNCEDRYAAAIVYADEVVGHVPYNLAKSVSLFLSRSASNVFSTVTGSKVNRGAGYGLEVPVVYCLYGPSPYIRKMNILIDNLRANGLI